MYGLGSGDRWNTCGRREVDGMPARCRLDSFEQSGERSLWTFTSHDQPSVPVMANSTASPINLTALGESVPPVSRNDLDMFGSC